MVRGLKLDKLVRPVDHFDRIFDYYFRVYWYNIKSIGWALNRIGWVFSLPVQYSPRLCDSNCLEYDLL